MKFGCYAQTVLCVLVTSHGWDDPYASMSPLYDNEGRIFNTLLFCWEHDIPVDQAAEVISKLNSNSELVSEGF